MKMKGETQNGNRGQRRKEATVNVLMLKTSTHQFLPHKSHPFCHHYHHHHVKTGTITRKPSTSIENPDLKKKKKAHQGSKKNRKIHFFFLCTSWSLYSSVLRAAIWFLARARWILMEDPTRTTPTWKGEKSWEPKLGEIVAYYFIFSQIWRQISRAGRLVRKARSSARVARIERGSAAPPIPLARKVLYKTPRRDPAQWSP